MDLVGLILLYVVLASVVVGTSIKLANYIDLIDKKTNLSGAFIGGVLLAAITSLPEMFTSISAVTYVKQPDLVLGNILGSNIFNLCVLAFMIVLFTRKFEVSRLSKSHSITTLFTIVCYFVVSAAVFIGVDPQIITVSVFSILILTLYVVGVRYMATDTDDEKDEDNSNLTLKQVVTRFVIFSVVLVLASIFVTKVTDELSEALSLGSTLAGALFLGIATSLPELTTTFTLTKMGNFNTATGNIVGSNLFNFVMLFLADVFFIGSTSTNSIYVSGSEQTKWLTIFGVIASLFMSFIFAIKAKNLKKDRFERTSYIVLGLLILASYAAFLILA